MNSSHAIRVPYRSYTHPGTALFGLPVDHYLPLESDWWELPRPGNCGNGPLGSPCICCPVLPSPPVAHHVAPTSPGTVGLSDPRLDCLATGLQNNKVKILVFLCIMYFYYYLIIQSFIF